MDILLGSDPELFVKDGDEFLSAHGMVEGTKENPFIVDSGAVQVDGMALEYNTNPVSTLEDWEHHHRIVQQQLGDMLKKGLMLSATPTAFFSEDIFNAAPAEAKILGCEPDYNAWTKEVNPQPDDKVTFRTGAGHIHIGWTKDENILDPFHLGECYALVKVLDLFLGIPSVILDKDKDRRKLYGKAGAFRPKSYGLEYRVLSNFWTSTPELRAWAYNSVMKAIDYAVTGEPVPRTVKAINRSSIADANYYCRVYGVDNHV